MFKSIVKIFSSHVIVKAIGLLNIVIVLKFLVIADFGEYSYMLVLLNLAAIFIDPFLSAYLIENKLNEHRKFNFGILLFSITLMPIFYLVLKTLNSNINGYLFLIFSTNFILTTSLKSYLNVNEKYFKYGIVDVVKQLSIISTTLFFFYILKENNYIKLIELNYLISLLFIGIFFCFLVKKGTAEIKIEKALLNSFFRKSLSYILYVAIVPFITFFDSFFIEKNLTNFDLGIYSFSLKIYNVSLILVIPIFTVLNIKQLEIAKKKGYTHFVKKHFKKVIFYAILFLTVSLVFNFLIIRFVLTAYSNSFLYTSILLFASFITYVSMPFSFLLAYKKYEALLILGLLAIIFNIGFNFVFINSYGLIIPTIATVISQAIISLGGAFLSYYLLKKE